MTDPEKTSSSPATLTNLPRRNLLQALGPAADYIGLGFVLIAMAVIFSALTHSSGNFLNAQLPVTIANRIPKEIILAIGMTFVLLIGGIDLSVGSVMALSGATAAWLIVTWQMPLSVAILASLAVGATCGLINGLVTVRWKLPAFIVTLGMYQIAGGLAEQIANPTISIDPGVTNPLAVAFGGFAMSTPIALLLVVVAQIVISYTVYGRYVIAVGTNEEAVRLSGIRPARLQVSVFVISGICAGMAALVSISETSTADPNAGSQAELKAIAAAVIGGTSLMGGRGSVIGALLGVLIMEVLGYGLTAMDIRNPAQRVITGGVIVAAAVIDYYRRRVSVR